MYSGAVTQDCVNSLESLESSPRRWNTRAEGPPWVPDMGNRNRWRALLAALLMSIVFAVPDRAARAEAGFVGMHIQGMSPAIAEALGMKAQRGVLVRDVALDGPAAAAGFQRGDLIVEFGGTKVDTFERMVQAVRKRKAGDVVDVVVIRGEDQIKLKLGLGKWPDSWRVKTGAFAALPELGLTLAALTAKVRERFNVRWGSVGVVVTLVDEQVRDSLALKRGDVIVQVNQETVWKPARVIELYQAAKREGRKNVLLLVERPNGFQFMMLPTL